LSSTTDNGAGREILKEGHIARLFVTDALRALHARRVRSTQRCLDAKSFRHYANDAYSPYEIFHVIGSSRDHFLPSNEKAGEREREGNWERSKREEESLGRGGGGPLGFYLSLLRREYVPYFRSARRKTREERSIIKGEEMKRN